MEYKKLIAVTGLPGLFELISSRADGAVVRSLEENKTQFIASRIHNFSHLESIEVFTQRENVNLVDVFQAMEKASGSLPDTKDADAVKKYFEEVYPEMDFDRVYSSDLKKMVKWFDSLKKHGIEIKLDMQPEKSESVVELKEEPEKKETKKETKKVTKQKEEKPKTKKTKDESKKEEGKKKTTGKKKSK